MIFDNHMHTEFSFDSEMKVKDAIAKADKLGMGIVFTEHFDYDYPGEEDFTFPPEAYMEAYSPFRCDHLRLGVEIGMTKESREVNKQFINKAPFDLVIGSIHLLNGRDIYFPDFYRNRSKEDVYRTYFTAMAEEAAVQDIDVLGHIDYMARYAPYAEPKLDYKCFKEEIDEVLRIILDRGIIIELNSRRLGDRQALEELTPIYSRYREMGGKYVTIGSDAHTADAIGANFNTALDFIETVGLRQVTFCERKLQIVAP
ncbi:MAG: histidinol-phosphatase HisJ family protein [Selenomonadaceae bacterium]|nr:histidinol-phosphatase HisJ family protein [Selenomonadaceae bacterium]